MAAVRAPARFAQLGLACVGVLSALGVTHLVQSKAARPRYLAYALLVLAFFEYGTGGNIYLPLASKPTGLSRWLASKPGIVLFQWPAPDPSALPDPDPAYVFESTKDWTPMVNGYSGFYPETYLEVLEATRRFPEPAALEAVRGVGATHIAVHPWRLTQESFDEVTRSLRQSGLTLEGCFNGPFGLACVFRF
jgi:hypothetical protein